MNDLELQPAHELWHRYKPAEAKYAFRAQTNQDALAWQEETRNAFSDTLGFQEFSAPLEVEVLEVTDKGSYTREKILLRTAEHGVMPVYLLLPKEASRPLPTVLALHGHGYGVKDIVGRWEDGSERTVPDGVHRDFAVSLCQQGFAVAAPEIACFGERQTDFSHLGLNQTAPTSCMHAAMLASHLGGTVAGIRVRDNRRLIDYLEDRADFDLDRLAVMGLSGGGMLSLFTACLEQRIRACAISGYFSTFKDSILSISHCACNFVPGMHRFGEMADLAGLVAPRPLFIEAGTRDPIFPLEAVKKGVAQAREVYRVFGIENRLETDYFEGRHRIQGKKAYAFLRNALTV